MSLADPYRHEIMCDDFTTGAQRINGNIPGMSMSEAASKDEVGGAKRPSFQTVVPSS